MESLEQLRIEIRTSHLSRRDVLKRAMGLGLSAPVIASLLAGCGGDDDDDDANEPTATEASAAQPTATQGSDEPTTTEEDAGEPTATAPADEPTATDGPAEPTATELSSAGRGQGGTLRLIYVNAATILNPHLASGGHESQTISPVIEPLLHIDADANLVPALAAEVPSLENGGVAEDGMNVTYGLREDVVWSDGEPFTAEDVRFTWEYITHPETPSTSVATYRPIADVEIVDDYTVTIHFSEPTSAWFVPFSTGFGGGILPRHLLQDYVGANAQEAPFNLQPVGTGPYKVAEFQPGDTVSFEINELYRDPDKPYFRAIEFSGGLEATLTVRSVLQTGEADYTWFIQTEQQLLDEMLSGDPAGELIVLDGPDVERIVLNLSNPHEEVDGELAKLGEPHPFQSDLAVRQAFTYIVDRDAIAEQFFGVLGKPTANTLAAPPQFASPNTSYEFDLERAAQLLDEAGWTVQDGVRQKDGVEMRILYQSSVIPIRQKIQEVVKQALESLGIPTELKAVPGSSFFSSDAGNPDTLFHFYADWQMFANGPNIPYPIDYMAWYKSDEPDIDIPQEQNGWSGRNIARWVSDEYNALYGQSLVESDPELQAELFIGMNDLIVMQDVIEIPLVHRSQVAAKNRNLKGNSMSPWTTDFWDIQNWYLEE